MGVGEIPGLLIRQGSSTVRGMAPGGCGVDMGDERIGDLLGRYREGTTIL